MANAKPMTSNDLKICYEWDAPGVALVSMYTIWMGITSFCIYIIFKRYEHGLEAIYSPQLRLHLWINKMIVPALMLTTVACLTLAIVCLGTAFAINPSLQNHRATFEIASSTLMIFDYLVNSFIMYYTIYGFVFLGTRDQGDMVWISFPGVPAIQITRSCFEEFDYLRQFEVTDENDIASLNSGRQGRNMFRLSVPNHQRLMDFVMSQSAPPIAMYAANEIEYDSDQNLNAMFRPGAMHGGEHQNQSTEENAVQSTMFRPGAIDGGEDQNQSIEENVAQSSIFIHVL